MGPALILARAIRVHQWAKNLLLFVPVLAGHFVRDGEVLKGAALGFVAWSLVASAVYLINDLWDLESDRRHPEKRYRPLASGQMRVSTALVLIVAFLVAAWVLTLHYLPADFWVWLGVYFLLTGLYSFVLKRRLLADVLTLAALYTIRILGGGAATGIPISNYLLAFAMFLFTSLAFAKRFAELEALAGIDALSDRDEAEGGKAIGRAYIRKDLDIVRVVGPTNGYLAMLVLALYFNSLVELAARGSGRGAIVHATYRHPEYLYLMCPLLAYWITRVWFIANRGHLHQDPVVFALKDPKSYAVGASCAAVVIAAKVLP